MCIWQREGRNRHVYIAGHIYKADEKLCTSIWWTCLFGKRWTGRQKDVRLSRYRGSLSRNQLHQLTRHTQSQTHKHLLSKQTSHILLHTHQCIKDEDVVVIMLRVLHHNVEQGIQSVLQELLTHIQTKKRSRENAHMLAYKTLVFTPLTLTTSSPSMILSFSRLSLRRSGLVLHLSSPRRPTAKDRHTENVFCLVALAAHTHFILLESGCWSKLL